MTADDRHRDESHHDPQRGVLAAPSWARWMAMAIDALPIMALWLSATFGLVSATEGSGSRWNLLDQLVDFINAHPGVVAGAALLLGALIFIWPLLCEIAWGVTPGKHVMGLMVVRRSDGGRPSPWRIAAHCLLRVLSVGLLFSGLLWGLADPERRTLHDRLAGVMVIRTR